MATFSTANIQSTAEIRTYTVDFTNDLPSGGTVAGGTATHTPPSGAATIPVTSVVSPYVYVAVGPLTQLGVHYVDVLATFSNNDKSAVRIPLNVVYPTPTARTGMVDLITELRGLTDAGVNDYSIAGIPYWSDAQMQTILDKRRTDLKWVELEAWEEADGSYLTYASGYGNLEQTTGGTAIFIVQDVNGDPVLSPTYTVDYNRGLITFDSNTSGLSYWLTARSYDLNAAAADVWRKKMVHYHTAYNYSTNGDNRSRAALYEHAKEMAAWFEGMGQDGVSSVTMFRSDTD